MTLPGPACDTDEGGVGGYTTRPLPPGVRRGRGRGVVTGVRELGIAVSELLYCGGEDSGVGVILGVLVRGVMGKDGCHEGAGLMEVGRR